MAHDDQYDDPYLRGSLIGSEGSMVDVNSEEESHSLKRKSSSKTLITVVPEKLKPINQSPFNNYEHRNGYTYHKRETSKKIWEKIKLKETLAKEKDLMAKPEPNPRWLSESKNIAILTSPQIQQRSVTH